MLSDTEVADIIRTVAIEKGYDRVSVIVTSDGNRKVQISGGTYTPNEFALRTDATAEEVREIAEKFFSVKP